MKMYQIYVCETCGKESSGHDEIELCEAVHLGLTTLEEKHEYDALKSAAAHFGWVVENINNDRTRAAYDAAIEKLTAFEKVHDMAVK